MWREMWNAVRPALLSSLSFLYISLFLLAISSLFGKVLGTFIALAGVVIGTTGAIRAIGERAREQAAIREASERKQKQP